MIVIHKLVIYSMSFLVTLKIESVGRMDDQRQTDDPQTQSLYALQV